MRWASYAVLIGVGVLCGQASGQQTLTVEQARQKVAAIQPKDDLDLSKVTTLSPETAKELVRHTGGILLPGLTEISPETAEWLATHTGYLRLSGLSVPSKEVLTILGKQPGVLHLDLPKLVPTRRWYSGREEELRKLKALASSSEFTLHITGAERNERGDEDVLAVFGDKKTGRIVFWGWTSFEIGTYTPSGYRAQGYLAESLMKTTASLEFPEIERVSLSDARKLIAHKGPDLVLGIKTLDADVASVLAEYPGRLVLSRLDAITALAAEKFRPCKGTICLPVLKTAMRDTVAVLKENPKVETPALEQ